MSGRVSHGEGTGCRPRSMTTNMDRSEVKSWTAHPTARKGFLISGYITLLVIALVVTIVLFGDNFLPGGGRAPIGWFPFALFLLCILVMFIAEAYLWVGMLFFLCQVDRGSLLSRCLWFLALVVANAWAAALYYFTVYRPFLTRDRNCSLRAEVRA